MRLAVANIFKYLLYHKARNNTHHVLFTMNPSPLTFARDEILFGLLFVCLFCFVWCFLVDKINVRSCVSTTATTGQTLVSGQCFATIHILFYLLGKGGCAFGRVV